MLKNKIIIICCSCVVSMSSVLASVCENFESAIAQTTPTERFIIHDEAPVVTDRATQLMWARCPLNVAWVAGIDRCDDLRSSSQFTWQEALNFDTSTLDDGMQLHSGWRLPNIKELFSIIERSCLKPAINDELFPGANFGMFWTSTPLSGEEIWVVNFTNGIEGNLLLSTKGPYVRLVRDITLEEKGKLEEQAE